MATGTCLVRRLRLRAVDDASIRRAAVVLEDALRTASLPDAGGRLIVVRQLALAIDPRSASQSLALGLERQLAYLRTSCIHAGDKGAAGAPAVWFRDALEAHTLLAVGLAAGEPLDAWFWPSAVGAWNPGLPVAEGLRRIALSLAALPEAAVALPNWAAALLRAGHLDLLAEAIRPADIHHLAQAARIRMPSSRRSVPTNRHPSAMPLADPGVRTFLRLLTRDDAAAEPMATGSGETRPHVRPSDAEARASLGDNIRNAAQPERRAGARVSSGTEPVRTGDGGGEAAHRCRQHAVPGSAPKTASNHRPEQQPNPEIDSHEPHPRREAEEPMPHAETAWPTGVATKAGGLLFLIPLLQRLGYPEWLEAQPAWARWDIARRMFAIILRRLSVPDDDPAWQLAVVTAGGELPPARFIAPPRWRDGLCAAGALRLAKGPAASILYDASARLLLAAWRGSRPRELMPLLHGALPSSRHDGYIADQVAEAWLTACRRWLRRYAGIGLADLVRRPAAIAMTTTHVDIFFAHHQADLRPRRAGLDLDPGWVPWLLRIVAFHYACGSGETAR